jgi:hypothetical protein
LWIHPESAVLRRHGDFLMSRRAKLNSDQKILLWVGVLLAAAIIIAAYVLSRNW